MQCLGGRDASGGVPSDGRLRAQILTCAGQYSVGGKAAFGA